jgi:DNA (cytosine-5)-methyltransferase 1
MKKYKLGELFCGAGGLGYGILNANSKLGSAVEHVWANDFNKDACETYRNNICPNKKESVICSDVKDLNIDSLKDINAFAYGFPCNSFSAAGKRKGLDDEKYGMLYWYGIEVLKRFQPDWFIAENVSHITSAGSSGFKIILNDLSACGYSIVPHIYKAEEYGVPQARHRAIIVGIRNDLEIKFKIPSPKMFKNYDISSRTALSGIPDNASNNEKPRTNKIVERRLSYINEGENIWQAYDRLGDKFPKELKIYRKSRYSDTYRKLDPNKPSYTITASGGGGTHGYHWENRELTNRERARLQTFPDNYSFVGKKESVRKQIGMAVPCRLATIITEAILNTFDGIEYPYVESNINM